MINAFTRHGSHTHPDAKRARGSPHGKHRDFRIGENVSQGKVKFLLAEEGWDVGLARGQKQWMPTTVHYRE